MSFTTYFQFTHTSYLPLPPTRHQATDDQTVESADSVLKRGIRTALKLLHSPETMIALNPLVQHYSISKPNSDDFAKQSVDIERLAHKFNVNLAANHSCSDFKDSHNGEFVHYHIVDKFHMLGTSKLLNYAGCFRPLFHTPNTLGKDFAGQSNGLETISDPGNGVSLLGKWILGMDETRPGYLVLEEVVSVHCNIFMGWFVKGQMETAHAGLHKEFGRLFCEKMVQEDPYRGVELEKKAGMTWKQTEDLRRQESDRMGNAGNTAGQDQLTGKAQQI